MLAVVIRLGTVPNYSHIFTTSVNSIDSGKHVSHLLDLTYWFRANLTIVMYPVTTKSIATSNDFSNISC